MAGAGLAIPFGALIAGAVVIDYGVKSMRGAFSGGSSTSPFTGKIRLPVSGPGVRWERTDQGVDANTGKAGDPIYAVEAGVVTQIVDFYQGQPAVVISSPGLPGGATGIYYAEGISPSVRVGQKISLGQQIGVTTSQPTGLEFGFWKGTETLAQATGGYIEGEITQAGRLFHQFLNIPGKIY
jgi:murein DD-endopeptidase MepM/ murein hydrolase activator NlpD